MSKPWIIFLTLAGIAILVLLLWRSPPTEFTDLLNDKPLKSNYPSTFLIKAKTQQFDEKGKLSYELYSEKVNYYDKQTSDKPEVVLDKPHLIVYDTDANATKQNAAVNTTLSVTADKAEGSEQQDQLTLIGNVVLEQQAIDGKITRLNTDQLLLQPQRRYAETDKPVIISDTAGTTSATGLKVFFDEKRIELLSNVKGKYVPN